MVRVDLNVLPLEVLPRICNFFFIQFYDVRRQLPWLYTSATLRADPSALRRYYMQVVCFLGSRGGSIFYRIRRVLGHEDPDPTDDEEDGEEDDEEDDAACDEEGDDAECEEDGEEDDEEDDSDGDEQCSGRVLLQPQSRGP